MDVYMPGQDGGDGPFSDRLVMLRYLRIVVYCSKRVIRVIEKSFANRSPQEGQVAGIAAADFQSRPYVDLERLAVRDGEDGLDKAKLDMKLDPSDRGILAELYQRGQCHTFELLAVQIEKNGITPAEGERNIQSTLSNLTRRLRPVFKKVERVRRGLPMRRLRDTGQVRVRLSVEVAVKLAQEAKKLLDQGKAAEALPLAVAAIETDPYVMLAHLSLCLAARDLGPGFTELKILEDSFRRLRRRLEGYGMVIAVLETGMAGEDDKVRAACTDGLSKLEARRREIEPVLKSVMELFDLDGARELTETNELIARLRATPMTDTETREEIIGKIMEKESLSSLFRWAGRCWPYLPKSMREKISPHEWGSKTISVLVKLTEDPKAPADIIELIRATKESMRACVPTGSRHIASDAAAVLKVDAAYYADHGIRATDEELADMLGWTAKCVKEAREQLTSREIVDSDLIERLGDDDDEMPTGLDD